jgi:hypothetical protein
LGHAYGIGFDSKEAIKNHSMKKMFLGFVLVFGFLYQQGEAQVKVNLSVNIANQPAWGPTGYDHADFYYLPDADCYYDVNGQQFVYFENNQWVYGRTLPPRYGHVDLYHTYKVVINEPKPYLRADVYRKKYARYKGGRQRQLVIRDSRQEKYFASKGHPRHAEWEKKHGQHH